MTSRNRPHVRRLAVVAAMSVGAAVLALSSPSQADVGAVSGSACGYFTSVSLFGGPAMLRGCGQPADAPAAGASPEVVLPSTGSATPITASKTDGATAQYGPAKIFSGQYPNLANDPNQAQTSPPSGPLDVSTEGTTGPNGSVTSTASVSPGTQGTTDPNQPRGVGPGPIVADAVSSTCSASESGLSASTTITNGIVVLSTDSDGAALTSEPVPTNPPVNYTKSGTINNVGDSFRVVYNEQTMEAGSITVNAVHMYLLGPTAVGDLVIAQSHCDVTIVPGATTTTAGNTTTTAGNTTTTAGNTTTTAGNTTTTAGNTTTTAGNTTTTAGNTTTTAGNTTTTAGSPVQSAVRQIICGVLRQLAAIPFIGPFLQSLMTSFGCAAL